MPRLLAYVYENSEGDINGFICEKVDGRPPSPADHDACDAALQQLHSYGVVHGDLVKYNIMMTEKGTKFIDLEHVTLGGE